MVRILVFSLALGLLSLPAQADLLGTFEDGGNTIYTLDPATGGVAARFPSPLPVQGQLVIGLSGAEGGSVLLFTQHNNPGTSFTGLYRLDPTTGATLSIESLPVFFTGGLSYQTNAMGPDSIFTINNGGPYQRQDGYSGPLAIWAAPSGAGFPGGMGGDDNGRHFVFIQNGVFEFDPITGALIGPVPTPNGAGGFAGIAFDGTNLYLGGLDAAGAPTLWTLDPDTGMILNAVAMPDSITSLAWVGAIPEPTSLLLLGIAAAGIALRRRRR